MNSPCVIARPAGGLDNPPLQRDGFERATVRVEQTMASPYHFVSATVSDKGWPNADMLLPNWSQLP